MPQNPIRTKLNRVVEKYCAGRLTFAEAKNRIVRITDREAGRIAKGGGETYKEIVALGNEKVNAYSKLKRKEGMPGSMKN